MRSLEHEKADGDTVWDPGQSAQYEHGAGNAFTWVGRITELGGTLLKERQRNGKAPLGYLTDLPKSRYLTVRELVDFFFPTSHLHVLHYVRPWYFTHSALCEIVGAGEGGQGERGLSGLGWKESSCVLRQTLKMFFFLFTLLLCWMYKYIINCWGAKKKKKKPCWFKWEHLKIKRINGNILYQKCRILIGVLGFFLRYMNRNNMDNHSFITQYILRCCKITKDFHEILKTKNQLINSLNSI